GGDCGPVWCKYPFGNDTVYAQDGEQDTITCGWGEDTVYADAIDVVDGDCEHVIRAGAAPAQATPPAAHAVATLTATAAKTKLAKALAHGLRLTVDAPAAGRLTASARDASGATTVKAAGRATVT